MAPPALELSGADGRSVVGLLVAVAIGLAYDKRVASVFVVSSVAVFALLRGVAAA